jgi:peptidoglycan/LPS O-acetylase OafA/YrhL
MAMQDENGSTVSSTPSRYIGIGVVLLVAGSTLAASAVLTIDHEVWDWVFLAACGLCVVGMVVAGFCQRSKNTRWPSSNVWVAVAMAFVGGHYFLRKDWVWGGVGIVCSVMALRVRRPTSR